MPRDLWRVFFAERAQAHRRSLHGELLSPVTLTAFGANNVLMPCADVRVSAQILSAVPVSDNSHDLLYAQPGTPVDLARSPSGRLEITGLSKRGMGDVAQFTLNLRTGVLTVGQVIGYRTRTVALGELATATAEGFGTTPLEALVLVDSTGAILNVVA